MKLSDLQRYYEGPFGVTKSTEGEYLKLKEVENLFNKLLSGEKIIKPCPCCGNLDPEVVEYPEQENEIYTYFSKRYSVLCRYQEDGQGCGLESGHYKTEEEAVEAWEKRV